MSSITLITKTDFDELTQSSNDIYFLDFYADWCGPCKQMLPMLEKFSTMEDLSHITFVKVNIDEAENRPLVEQFNVQGIPDMFLVKFDNETKEVKVLLEVAGLQRDPLNFKKALLEATAAYKQD